MRALEPKPRPARTKAPHRTAKIGGPSPGKPSVESKSKCSQPHDCSAGVGTLTAANGTVVPPNVCCMPNSCELKLAAPASATTKHNKTIEGRMETFEIRAAALPKEMRWIESHCLPFDDDRGPRVPSPRGRRRLRDRPCMRQPPEPHTLSTHFAQCAHGAALTLPALLPAETLPLVGILVGFFLIKQQDSSGRAHNVAICRETFACIIGILDAVLLFD